MASFFHGVVNTFDAGVTTWGVGACREFVYTENFVNDCRWLGVNLEPVVG